MPQLFQNPMLKHKMQDALIVFVRRPELGKVKTRLAADVGIHKALEIYKKLLQHTFETASPLRCDKYTFVTEDSGTPFWDGFFCEQQQGVDLGMRMHHAFDVIFKKGYKKAVIIGSDCLQLTTALIQRAFYQLDKHAIVTGPAYDGGYYLLGMKQLHAGLFQNKPWSTTTVYRDTIQDIKKMGLKHARLPVLPDVDRVADVPEAWL
jgi:rSAM/selenodomain-associated transferase 1